MKATPEYTEAVLLFTDDVWAEALSDVANVSKQDECVILKSNSRNSFRIQAGVK